MFPSPQAKRMCRKVVINMYASFFFFFFPNCMRKLKTWSEKAQQPGILSCQCAIKEPVLLSEALCVAVYSHESFCVERPSLEGIICSVASFMVSPHFFSMCCSSTKLLHRCLSIFFPASQSYDPSCQVNWQKTGSRTTLTLTLLIIEVLFLLFYRLKG